MLLSKKARAGLFQKLGLIPPELKSRLANKGFSEKRIWFHAVSVGEFNALFPLAEEFHIKHPDWRILISTTTATGQAQAHNKANSFADIFYFPFDLPLALSNWLDLVKPDLVGIMETEIWPGFMQQCRKRNINVILLNGRLSPRSFQSYRRYKWFFKKVLLNFSAFSVQSQSEKERFIELADGNELNLYINGNIKLDGLKESNKAKAERLRQELNLSLQDLVIVAGSTHEGEEIAFINAIKEIARETEKANGRALQLKLILVPRHPERFERVAQLIETSGFRARRFSLSQTFEKEKDIYLLDTIGKLNAFYSVADIAFVGGTLADVGGHNLAEPFIHKVPLICGPHIHKTRDLFENLKQAGALLTVHNEKELSSAITLLANEPAMRQELGRNGYELLMQSQGALAKTLSLLEKYLDCRETNSGIHLAAHQGVQNELVQTRK